MPNRYCWLPLGDEDNATARLRCFYMHRYFIDKGVDSEIGFSSLSNVCIIQKRFDYRSLLFAFSAWKNGARIIIDINDLNPSSRDWRVRVKLFSNIVDGITAASNEQLMVIRRCLSNKQKGRISFFSYEEPVDYYSDLDVNTANTKRSKLTVCWFGNSGNFDILDEVHIIKKLGYQLLVISDNNPLADDLEVEFIAWGRHDFSNNLQANADICILSHFGDTVSMAKSANKMILSIAVGVPVVASNTPAYSRVARLCGLEKYLYDNVNELSSILQSLKNESQRWLYISKARQCVMNKFSISSVCTELDEWISSVECSDKRFIYNGLLVLIYLVLIGVVNKVRRFIAQVLLRIKSLH